VTSVAVSGTDGIEVDSGSPITGSGTIQLGINAATLKTTLDLTGTNSGDVTLAGALDYLTISGQTITRGPIDLATDTTGSLAWASVSKSGSSLADLATRSAADLTSGTLDAARLPTPGTTTLGGVKRNAGSGGQFVNGIDTDGSLLYGTPAGGGVTALQDELTGSNFTVTNSNTLTDVTGFNVSLSANKTYLFFLVGAMQSSGTGNGARLGFTLPSGASCFVNGVVSNPATGAGFITASGGYVQQNNVFSLAAESATLQGVIVNGSNAGNLQIQIACELTTGTAQINTGSRIVCVELP
jgi:hypothetical protein